MKKVCIVDYGVGNIYNLAKAFEAVGAVVEVSHEKKTLEECGCIVLPGVGAFGDAMESIRARELDEAIRSQAAKGKLVFGICLGMQLLFESSSEFGYCRGLQLLEGEVLELGNTVKKPHMGWNWVVPARAHPLLDFMKEGEYMYFVHSYYASTTAGITAAETDYGMRMTAAVAKDNLMGVQFHPEKSGEKGLQLLKNLKEMF